MKIWTFIVDAFTAIPYSGNPAAVCLIPFPLANCPITDGELQRIAFEVNLSETVFVFLPRNEDADQAAASMREFAVAQKSSDAAEATAAATVAHHHHHQQQPSSPTVANGDANANGGGAGGANGTILRLKYGAKSKHQRSFGIRWFTPQSEVGLCGHATLAAAHVLFSGLPNAIGLNRPQRSEVLRFLLSPAVDTVVFVSQKAGVLPVTRVAHTTMSAMTTTTAAAAPPIQRLSTAALEGMNLSSDNEGVAVVPASVFQAVNNVTAAAKGDAATTAAGGDAQRGDGDDDGAEAAAQLPRSASYQLNFPSRMPAPLATPFTEAQLAALAEAVGIARNDIEELQLHVGSQKYLLVCKSVAAVVNAKLSVPRLREIFTTNPVPPVAPLSVTLTARVGQSDRDAASRLTVTNGRVVYAGSGIGVPPEVFTDCDCVSRHFAPWVGIDEDPVTGAAHVVLGPYWCRRLKTTVIRGYQSSARGGFVHCQLVADAAGGTATTAAEPRMVLTGAAVTVLEGSMRVGVTKLEVPAWTNAASKL